MQYQREYRSTLTDLHDYLSDHADLVATCVTNSLQQLALEYKTPVIHEVILVEDEAQAHVRCLGEEMNRGVEAARAAASMVEVFS